MHLLAALFQGDTAAARSVLEPMLETAADDPRLLALEADVWRDEGNFAEAADRYRRLIWGTDKPPRQATFTQHLGKVHFCAGQLTDAAECFQRALALRIETGASPDLVESSRAALARVSEERESPTSSTNDG